MDVLRNYNTQGHNYTIITYKNTSLCVKHLVVFKIFQRLMLTFRMKAISISEACIYNVPTEWNVEV